MKSETYVAPSCCEQVCNSAKQSPCGYYGHQSVTCRCSPDMRQRYQSRVSGPLLDRIDIQIEVASVDPEILAAPATGDSSAVIAARVQAAADRQLQRQGKRNQYLTPREIDHYCQLDRPGKFKLRESMQSFKWSGRAYHRILRVARTVADLAGAASIQLKHVEEAIQYRRALVK